MLISSIYLVLVYVLFYAVLESPGGTVSLQLLVIAHVAVLGGAPIYLLFANILNSFDATLLLLIGIFGWYSSSIQYQLHQLKKGSLPSTEEEEVHE